MTSLLAAVLAAVVATAVSVSRSDIEHGVHDRVNAERARAKLAKLKDDDELSDIARAHSEDMARRRFFSHVNPNGEDPTARGRRAGYECRKIMGNVIRTGLAENLYEASGTARENIERRSVAGWMNSPGHRANILGKNYSRTGVGVAVAGDAVFITQLFC